MISRILSIVDIDSLFLCFLMKNNVCHKLLSIEIYLKCRRKMWSQLFVNLICFIRVDNFFHFVTKQLQGFSFHARVRSLPSLSLCLFLCVISLSLCLSLSVFTFLYSSSFPFSLVFRCRLLFWSLGESEYRIGGGFLCPRTWKGWRKRRVALC